ncbi:MAG: NAD(P) transhydrogenase subunit alpha [Acidobacteriota bacterium]|nr:NAD(P) transhydrogenase subunit alpha [Acidobacteriota bacterium]MDH3529916.1 NAD(P) transhydrogenase subunit alpha [Acidobacteriota bacterium]
MLIGVLKESEPGEKRAALVPADVKKLNKAGLDVIFEAGTGVKAGFSDSEYSEAGAKETGRDEILGSSDIVLRVRKPPSDEIGKLKKDSIHISFLDPFNEAGLIDAFRESGVTAISMEMIPRTTLAQKMDALSSQANLAGYVMVILAADNLPRIMPMMMTPSGTLKPASVFVIGVGVAGLQAIATAKRLGAKVTAFDTRSETIEQVKSLGAKFLEIDLGETASTKDGYAVELTPEQIEIQKQAQKEQIAKSDIVITTAQVFGRKPPVIVPSDAVAGMKAGSVVVDMAAVNGGNVECSEPGKTVEYKGVKVVGTGNWPCFVAKDASVMYSANLYNLLDQFLDKETNEFSLDLDDEILSGCVITHGGEIKNEMVRKASE